MKQKKEQNIEEILEGKQNARNPKNVILGAIVVVIIIIIALLIWSFSKSHDEKPDDAKASVERLQDDTYTKNAESDSSDTQNLDSDDRFNQIVNDVKNQADQDASDEDFQPLNAQPKSNKATPNSQDDTQMEAPNAKNVGGSQLYPEPMSSKSDRVPTPSEVMKNAKSKPAAQKSPVQKAPASQTAPKPQAAPKPQPAAKPSAPKALIQGQEAVAGSYLQVGAFSAKPNQELLELLKKHPYRTQQVEVDGETLTKYLIGPFKDRAQASHYKETHSDLEFSVYYEIQ